MQPLSTHSYVAGNVQMLQPAQNKGTWSLKHPPPLKTSRILQLGILRHPPDASMCEESAGLQIMDLR